MCIGSQTASAKTLRRPARESIPYMMSTFARSSVWRSQSLIVSLITSCLVYTVLTLLQSTGSSSLGDFRLQIILCITILPLVPLVLLFNILWLVLVKNYCPKKQTNLVYWHIGYKPRVYVLVWRHSMSTSRELI